MYFKYFLYICDHKKKVFLECWKRGLYFHAFTHDLSKFLPDEFFPYAKWFYGKNGTMAAYDFEQMDCPPESPDYPDLLKYTKNKLTFKNAFSKHLRRNKHHWDHSQWVDRWWYTKIVNGKRERIGIASMPEKYIKQLFCDWVAMESIGKPVKDYYISIKDKIMFDRETRQFLEALIEQERR